MKERYWFTTPPTKFKAWNGETPKYVEPGENWVEVSVNQARSWKNEPVGSWKRMVYNTMPRIVSHAPGGRPIW